MRVEYLTEKGSADLNEDAYLLQEPLFAVFDGATSKVPYRDAQGRTGARLAAEIARETVSHGNGTPVERLRLANTALARAMAQAKIPDDKLARWASAAAVILITEETVEWAQISDTIPIFLLADGTYELPVTDYDHDGEVLAEARRRGKGPWLEQKNLELRKRMNIDYGILDGEPEAEAFIRSGTRSREGLAGVLLVSDGLFLPREDPLAPDDIAGLVQRVREGGLPQLLRDVRVMENEDPALTRYPRHKLHDDATGVAIYF